MSYSGDTFNKTPQSLEKSGDNLNVPKRKSISMKHDDAHKKKFKLCPNTKEPEDGIEEPNFDELKLVFKDAVKEFTDCKKKLEFMIRMMKKIYPSVLESQNEMISEAISEMSVNNNDFPRYDRQTESLMEKDVSLVQTMKILMKEFHSYALVLETIPESSVIKKRILKELKNREELFEENLIKFKRNKKWLFSNGIQCLENQHQRFIRKKYETYMETLDVEMSAMRAKRTELIQDLENIHHVSKSQEEEQSVKEPEPTISKIVLENSPERKSSSPLEMSWNNNDYGKNEKKSAEECIIIKDARNKDASEDSAVACGKQDWPGKSLPVFDDLLISDESSNDVPADYNETTETIHSSSSRAIQDEFNDNHMAETLLTEFSTELDMAGNDMQNFGSHFLTTQYAGVTSTSVPEFGYSVAVKLDQNLSQSLLNASLSPEHVCSQCQQCFKSKDALGSHKLRVHVSRMCNLCTEIFENVLTLTDHVAKQHSNHVICPKCFEVVAQSEISEHATKHTSSNKETDDKIKCRACFKVFNSIDEVKIHEKNHKNAFHLCKVCGDLFLTQYDLRKHSNDKHLAVKTNICKVCLQDFDDKQSLTKHLKINHLMIKNQSPHRFACICCYQNYENFATLIQHMRQNHQNDNLVEQASQGDENGIVRNKCRHCSSYFKNSKVRAIHEIVFHETAPFLCACNEAFFTKAMLDRHLLKHTRTEEENVKPKRRTKMSF